LLRIWLFGGVSFQVDEGERIAPPSTTAQRVLAYLALNAGNAVDRTDAARKIWGVGGDQSFTKALGNLRRDFDAAGAASYLESIEGRRGRPGTIRLRDDELWVDAVEFEKLWRQDQPEKALELARGEFLSGLKDAGEWLNARRIRFTQRVANAHGLVARQLWEKGKRDAAIDHAERRCEAVPEDAIAHRDLMRYLARAGRAPAAIEVGENFLREHRGEGDPRETEKLIQEIRDGKVPAEPEPPLPGSRLAAAEAGGRLRDWRVQAAGAIALVALVVVAIVVISSGGSSEPGPLPCSAGVVQLSSEDQAAATAPRSLAVAPAADKKIPVGEGPAVIAVGSDGVWVGERQGIALIDPRTNSALGNLISTKSGAFALVLSKDRVWAALRNGHVVSVDRATHRLIGRPIRYGSGSADIAVGAGSVWVNNYGDEALDGNITRIDPCSGHLRRYKVGRSAVTVKYGFDSIWVSDPSSGTVARLDPKTGKVQSISGFTDPEDLLIGKDGVWVVQYARQTVIRIDPETNKIVGSELRVGPDPGGITEGAGALWLPLYGNGTVTSVDIPAGPSHVGVVRVGESPTDAAVGYGRVWVPNNGEDTVTPISSQGGSAGST
jgi:DNA-binding beta-propeller fold protein YncE/DNA-binding SARP family transcriptional activator